MSATPRPSPRTLPSGLPADRQIDPAGLRDRIQLAEFEGLPANDYTILLADARTFMVNQLREGNVLADYGKALRDTGLSAQTLVNDAMVAIGRDEVLPFADVDTVLGAVMNAAQLGLRIDVGGQCFLAPYWSRPEGIYKCQLIVGYQGYLAMCYRTGKVDVVCAEVVYQCEQEAGDFDFDWVFEPGSRGGARMHHKPHTGIVSRSEEPVHAFYATALMTSGGYAVTRPWGITVMEEHRDLYAKRLKNGLIIPMWADPRTFPQMGRKTMVRELCLRSLPHTGSLVQLFAADEGTRVSMSPTLGADAATVYETADRSIIIPTAEDLEAARLSPADR